MSLFIGCLLGLFSRKNHILITESFIFVGMIPYEDFELIQVHSMNEGIVNKKCNEKTGDLNLCQTQMTNDIS